MGKEKIVLDGTVSVMEYIRKNAPGCIGVPKTGYDVRKNRIVRKTFKNIKFTGNLHDIEFRSVKFIDCEFAGIYGFFFALINCEFKKCSLRNSRFTHLEFDWLGNRFIDCYLRNVEFEEGSVATLLFISTTLSHCNFTGFFLSENIRFYDCKIDETTFFPIKHYEENESVTRDDEYIDWLFEGCLIDRSTFQEINFKNSRFINTVLYKSAFVDCILDNECFIVNKDLPYDSFASIDLQTILKSDELDNEILKRYFLINSKINIKNLVSKMTEKINLHTVFISYSFKDSLIAKRINHDLKKEGIRTFMWEKDAPAGKPLEEIMTSGITAHDKLLFIASEHSIKSKACQFELTTARKKQEQSWENVFFPIKIDDYIFKVKKSQIRPIETADDYWKNIEEIKAINMLDFSPFQEEQYDKKAYNRLFKKIVEGLNIEA
ncbi:toll/interleukin-1 receptor domain-containing protein [Edaphocola aurantiacus]|uniref:toll/interleukin-1 receptor domain-containing protein n=1 Tax=Edaphocola aurantiacus TaxID=2601682 RepID=UPI001C93E79B|nr:TIR domain-containing protein [Edaphocola aurantiacus]